MLKKPISLVFLLFFLFFAVFSFTHFVFAQEESNSASTTMISQEVLDEIQKEEDISAQDLEIKEPKLLPDSPFYFVKNWWRGIRLGLTSDPTKKALLRQRFANEKLIELKKLAERKKDPKAIEKARKNYEKETEALKRAAERIKNLKDKKKVESFLDKFIRHQILHQKLLENLENQVPPETFGKVKETREKHLERFKDVMLKLEDKDKLPERLEKAIEKTKGSEFKEIKALEILKRVEEKTKDEDAKEAIQRARERILNRTKQRLEQMPEKKRKTFEKFIETLPGDKEKRLEILEDLREKLKENPKLEEHLKETRKKVLKRIVQKNEEKLKKMECPEIVPPEEGFCEEGRVIIKKDENGCPQIVCVNPSQIKKELKNRLREKLSKKKQKVCIDLWDPVCGKDGKTYSNACFAKIAGVEIAHKGICEDAIKEKLPSLPRIPKSLKKEISK